MRTLVFPNLCNRRGFTLVEMLIAMVVGMLVMAAVTGVFISHSRTYTMHDDVSALQQNLRGALMVMPADIRMARCDPQGTEKSEILQATPVSLEFTADLGGDCNAVGADGKCTNNTHPNEADGDIEDGGERVHYAFRVGYSKCKGGVFGDGAGVLCRKAQDSDGNWSSTGLEAYHPLASDIDRVEFNYIVRDKKSFISTTTPEPKQIPNISAVQISILARTNAEDPRYKGPEWYYPASCGGEDPACKTRFGKCQDKDCKTQVPFDDHYRRRLVVSTVQIRNKGAN